MWGNFAWTSFTSCLIIRSLAKQTGALQHSQAATTKCISALPAKRRLLISGTPIQNSGLACHLFSWCPVESVDALGWWIVRLAAGGRKGRVGSPALDTLHNYHMFLYMSLLYFTLWSMMFFWYIYIMILVVSLVHNIYNLQTYTELYYEPDNLLAVLRKAQHNQRSIYRWYVTRHLWLCLNMGYQTIIT